MGKLSTALTAPGKLGIASCGAGREASGIGGSATSSASVLCPCTLGGQAGVIKLAVVKEDVPQLLSIGLLEHGGAIIDTNINKITFVKLDKEQKMTKQTPIGLVEFFQFPSD